LLSVPAASAHLFTAAAVDEATDGQDDDDNRRGDPERMGPRIFKVFALHGFGKGHETFDVRKGDRLSDFLNRSRDGSDIRKREIPQEVSRL
jgi:hypothetical protein